VIGSDRPLVDLLPGSGGHPDPTGDDWFAFVQDGDGLVGWGVAARVPVGTGPGRLARAREGVRALLEGSNVVTTLPGIAPVAFASFTFDEDEDASVVVVPRVVVGRRGERQWMTTVGADAPRLPALADTRAETARGASRDRPRHAGSTLRDDAWLDAVASALEDIGTGGYEKVVLARDLLLWSRDAFDMGDILRTLTTRFPSCATFLVDRLVGASPERLVRLSGPDVSSRVLAGTTSRGVDTADDERLGAALLTSDKDLREHRLALRSAVDALETVCADLQVPDHPSLVRLDNVQHLGTDLSGQLSTEGRRDTDVLDLVARLHPTAAVGGAPRPAAMAAIRRLEGMSRGRYAGPVGWFTPDGDGEFAIALRCAEVHDERARLFAGAGIVAGSLPEAELMETWLKLRAMTGVLDR